MATKEEGFLSEASQSCGQRGGGGLGPERKLSVSLRLVLVNKRLLLGPALMLRRSEG